MKVEVDESLCIGCGLCVNTAPDVFRMGDDDKSIVYVDDVPYSGSEPVQEAIDGCPTNAIYEN